MSSTCQLVFTHGFDRKNCGPPCDFSCTHQTSDTIPIPNKIKLRQKTILCFKHLIPDLNSWTKLPIVPVYGGFPVKLRTHVGQPLHPEHFESVAELREAVLNVSLRD